MLGVVAGVVSAMIAAPFATPLGGLIFPSPSGPAQRADASGSGSVSPNGPVVVGSDENVTVPDLTGIVVLGSHDTVKGR